MRCARCLLSKHEIRVNINPDTLLWKYLSGLQGLQRAGQSDGWEGRKRGKMSGCRHLGELKGKLQGNTHINLHSHTRSHTLTPPQPSPHQHCGPQIFISLMTHSLNTFTELNQCSNINSPKTLTQRGLTPKIT